MSKNNLIIHGPSNIQLGYGHACFNLLINLQQYYNVKYFSIGQPLIPSEYQDTLKQCIKSNYDININDPCLIIWHEFGLIEKTIGKGKYIGFPFFELNKLGTVSLYNINYMDHICVASEWAANILCNHRVKCNVSVVPLGVDRSIFYPQTVYQHTDNFYFLNIAKIEKRKGHDVLIQAFNKAFTQKDNVVLGMMWHNPFLTPQEIQEWEKYYKSTPLGNKIIFVPPVETDKLLAHIINTAHCCIFPTRAEGFGLPILQSLSCGKPVITTNYSGHSEYVNDDNSYLLEIDELEDAYDNVSNVFPHTKWFYGQGQWGKITDKHIDQIVDYMRYVYKERPSNQEGIETAKQFTWENSVQKLINILE